ncbi:MAG: membrane protein insertase YidC [Rhodocyclaceae bacterium]|nr:membrane protein insertase YidC [Rhodocyclaceae bacterium]MBX3669550.1 membrane protein insertase YidC [Rhodocyclaceae bacterium]
MENQKTIILLVIFGLSSMMLWTNWQRANMPTATQQQAATPGSSGQSGTVAPPTPGIGAAAPASGASPPAVGTSGAQSPRLVVKTDFLVAEITAQGGDIVKLEFLKHHAREDVSKPFQLLDDGSSHIYKAQSGLLGGYADHNTVYRLPAAAVELKPGEDKVEVRLSAPGASGVDVTKVLSFKRSSYLIDTKFEIRNGTNAAISPSAYFQLLRDGKKIESDAKMVSTFTGPATYTSADNYQKIEFSKLDKEGLISKKGSDGWVAMVQHYFVSAYVPVPGPEREYYARKQNDLYAVGLLLPLGSIAAGATGSVDVPLYSGPQETSNLEKIAPGLELVVDYGWLKLIAFPIYWLLSMLHKLVGNWGWAIILLTIGIKLMFFPLSAASYKSMAKMRQVGPRLQRLKEQFGDDRARMNQEMMELYKREKINPLGGCLPILVQIPVFISLYWVLLGAVEMRHAPWVLWIADLSDKDPYFVMPLVMGATMLIQTKLNPTPPDPIQAKVMWLMPIVFTGMFLFFPAGLVLYWTINNLLSIAQQWQINRMIEGGKAKAA